MAKLRKKISQPWQLKLSRFDLTTRPCGECMKACIYVSKTGACDLREVNAYAS